MPKLTAFLVARLQESFDESLDLSARAEKSSEFVYTSRLHVYEAAYLMAFCAWENFLEEVTLRFLCGYENNGGVAIMQPGKHRQADLADARSALYGSNDFLLWHNPSYPIKRSRAWFLNGPVETVIDSAKGEIESFANIRHFVAHRNEDSKEKFDAASRALKGTATVAAGVLGLRAGRFLRESVTELGVTTSWQARICADLRKLADQIAG